MSGLTEATEHVYFETRYAAGTWKNERRVIIKAEVVKADGKEPRDVDRTSCTRFWANQMRVLMTAAAYVLMQEVRLAAALAAMARAQVWTLRERLLKLGARVVSSVRRLVVHLPESFPWRSEFHKVAHALGSTAG